MQKLHLGARYWIRGTAIRVRRDASVELLGKAILESCHIYVLWVHLTHTELTPAGAVMDVKREK